MLYGIVCFAIGFLCGMTLAAMLAIAGSTDERQERPPHWWGRGL